MLLVLLLLNDPLRTSAPEQNRLKLFLRWGGKEFEREKPQMRHFHREYKSAAEGSYSLQREMVPSQRRGKEKS